MSSSCVLSSSQRASSASICAAIAFRRRPVVGALLSVERFVGARRFQRVALGEEDAESVVDEVELLLQRLGSVGALLARARRGLAIVPRCRLVVAEPAWRDCAVRQRRWPWRRRRARCRRRRSPRPPSPSGRAARAAAFACVEQPALVVVEVAVERLDAAAGDEPELVAHLAQQGAVVAHQHDRALELVERHATAPRASSGRGGWSARRAAAGWGAARPASRAPGAPSRRRESVPTGCCTISPVKRNEPRKSRSSCSRALPGRRRARAATMCISGVVVRAAARRAPAARSSRSSGPCLR